MNTLRTSNKKFSGKKEKTSISNPRQKVHFQKKKAHKICSFIPSLSSLLQKWRTEGAAGRHHWASTIVITVFSKTSPLLQALFRYSLLHLYLSLRNYSKFTLIIEYCVSRIRWWYSPISQGSPISILLHSVLLSFSLLTLFFHKYFWNFLG